MYTLLDELSDNVLSTAERIMETRNVDLDTIQAIQSEGLAICETLDETVHDEIVDDLNSLRLKLETVLLPTHLNAFSMLCSLVSISDKLENIKPSFEPIDEDD